MVNCDQGWGEPVALYQCHLKMAKKKTENEEEDCFKD